MVKKINVQNRKTQDKNRHKICGTTVLKHNVVDKTSRNGFSRTTTETEEGSQVPTSWKIVRRQSQEKISHSVRTRKKKEIAVER